MQLLLSEIFLGISIAILILMMMYLKKSKSQKRLVILFDIIFILMLIWDSCLFLQYLFADKLNINPIYFDYITYIGIMFLPVFLYLTAQTFTKKNFKIKRYHLLLFVVPIISLTVLWTNDWHHLFYTNYSLFLVESTFGPYFYIHALYTYSLILISLGILVKYSVQKNHKITAQTLLLLLAIAIPVFINIVGTLDLMHLSIYATPISFTISVILLFVAIFKFDFLNINSIALQVIVNTISDSYIVIDSDNIVTACNKSFLTTFGLKEKNILNKDIYSLNFNIKNFSKDDIYLAIDFVKLKNSTFTIDKYFKEIDKYFSIDFSPITKNDSYIGTLIFLKDVTELEKDKIKIKSNQNLLIEQERLASLGQMIGGIAHNLKTPIFSISGGLEGLSDLIKEFDESIGDPSVTNDDMHDIAKDMNEWIRKLKEYISYMSEVITTVKGQAVTMSDEEQVSFSVSELFQHVDILMKHELNKKLATLNINNSTLNQMQINGNINSLVQVINNLISNAIEAYEGTNKEKTILLSAKYNESNKNIIISVTDYGTGLPENVQEKLFKEMITTKGKNGTGLGLFMSYSNIRAHFNGDITFVTEKDKGTTFNISIPIK
jgi:signal transduction histidine kinase